MIRNAVRHTAAGTTVRVAPCVNHDGSLLAVVITDQGPGVDHHRLHSIFQPFERGASEAGAGFGLGLAIALHALEMHGGTIAARNQAGGGGGWPWKSICRSRHLCTILHWLDGPVLAAPLDFSLDFAQCERTFRSRH